MHGIDLSKPFPKPVAALDAVVVYLEDLRGTSAEAAAQVDAVLPWMRQLAGQVRFETRDPLVAFALGRLALDGVQRKAFLEALESIHRITEAA